MPEKDNIFDPNCLLKESKTVTDASDSTKLLFVEFIL